MGRGGESTVARGGEAKGSVRTRFHWDDGPEPHIGRKQEILKKHPEIKNLMGPCPYTKYQVAGVVSMQIVFAWLSTSLSWGPLILFAYLIGGAANCNLQLAMHEISHNLAFKQMRPNRILSIVANLPLGIPAAISFRKYHLDHHRAQGHDVIDVDVPCEWEGWFFTNPFKKFLWCMLQPAFYALRPVATNPKPLVDYELANILIQVCFDALIYKYLGLKALVYLVAGTLLGMGIHPTAYHFISEHCVFVEGYETYSYYGWLNAIMYNVGYHNEHHDFPNVPGSRLYLVKAAAPEYYDNLPYHTSWWKVYYDYLTKPEINPYARVKREPTDTTVQKLNMKKTE